MRKLVVLICIFLIISGLLLSFPEWNLWFEHEELLVLFHIWLGLFFMVIFPMYAWDHIRTHRHRLKSLTPVSFTGGSQLMAGIGLILSGLILLLYSPGGLRLASDSHEILTHATFIENCCRMKRQWIIFSGKCAVRNGMSGKTPGEPLLRLKTN